MSTAPNLAPQPPEPAESLAEPAESLAGMARTFSCVLDQSGIVTWAGTARGPLFPPGTNPVGSRFADHWRTSDASALAQAIVRTIRSGEAQVIGRALRENVAIEAALELRRAGDGRPAEIVVSMRMADQQSVVENDTMLFNAVPVAMWITRDTQATFILGNPVTERRFGFAHGSNQSLSQPRETLHDRYRYYQDGREVPGELLPVQRAARGEDVLDEEFEIRCSDGDVTHVILNAAPMRDGHGVVVGSVCVEIDITERKRFEDAQSLLLQCSRATGAAFFDELVLAISKTLNAQRVCVAEIVGENRGVLRALSACIDGKLAEMTDYTPTDAPCLEVMGGKTKFVPSGLRHHVSGSETLGGRARESYIGIPLRGVDGEIIGIIDVLNDKPLPQRMRPLEFVEIFAGRAAAELQRMRGERSLRQSEQKYRIISDVIPALVSFIDTEERYQFANQSYSRWFGMDPKRLSGQKVKNATTEDTYSKIGPYIRRALQGQRVSYETYLPDVAGPPRHILAEYVPQIADNGDVLGFFAFVNDISEHKAHEEALKRSEAQFRTLFEHLPVGVAMISPQGRILLENDVLTRLLPPAASVDGAANIPASIFDRACVAHLADGEPLTADQHPLAEALRGRVSKDVEFKCHHPNGRQRWVRMRGVPIRGHARDEVVGALVVVDDIHNEKLADERRNLLINELNHRVKNTLAGVQSIATQTFRGNNFTPAALEAFEERLLALSKVHNQLTYESWEGADLRRLAIDVMEPHNPGADRLHIAGPEVRLKPQAALALAMALHELATNAVKYGALSAPGGRLSLTWKTDGPATDRRLRIAWIESGGPRVTPPTSKGFGTRLIERSLAFELDSTSCIRFEPDGVICEIDADFREVAG